MAHFSRIVALVLVVLALAGVGQRAQAAPPTFSGNFTPNSVGEGAASVLTFTIDNSLQPAVSNLGFSVTLPFATGQMSVADNNASTTCVGGTLTAPSGATSITYSGGETARDTVCSVTVNVTAPVAGTYTIPPITLSSTAGNSTPSASFDLTVTAPPPAPAASYEFTLSDSDVREGEVTTATYVVTNIVSGSTIVFISFDHQLSPGVSVATPANVSSSCSSPGSVSVSASPGGKSLSVIGNAFLAHTQFCEVSVDLQGTTTGVYPLTPSNLTVGTQSIPAPTRTLTVDPFIAPVDEITISKSFSTSSVAPGGTVDLTFELNNANPGDAATNITFTDDLDAFLTGAVATGLPQTDVCGTGSSVTGASTLTLSGGTIPARSSCSFTVTVQVPAAAVAGTYTNTTSGVQADIGGTATAGSDTATDTLTVLAAQPLQFTRAFNPDSVAGGDPLVLDYTITNPNTGLTATSITIAENFGSRFGNLNTFSSADVTNCGAGAALSPIVEFGPTLVGFTFAGGELAPGASCSFTASSTVPVGTPSGSFVSTSGDLSATLAGSTITTPGQTDTLTINGGAAVTISADVQDTLDGLDNGRVNNGDQFDIVYTLENLPESTATATDIAFTLNVTDFAAGTTAVVQGNTCGGSAAMSAGDTLLTVGSVSLAPGNDCTITLRVTAAGGTNTDVSATTSDVTFTAAGNAGQAIGVTASIFFGDLLPLTWSHNFDGTPALAGDSITVTYEFENANSFAVTDVVFSHSLSGVLATMASTGVASDTCGFPTLTGTTTFIALGASIAANSSCSLVINVQIPGVAGSGDYLSETSALSANYDAAGSIVVNPSQAVLTVDNEPILFSKEFVNDPVTPGGVVLVRYTVENPLSTALSGITFTSTLDAALGGATFAGMATTNTCGGTNSTPGTATLSYSGGTLGAGASCVIEIDANIPAGAGDGSYPHTTNGLTATAGVTPVGADPASDTLAVNAAAETVFTASFAGGTIQVGGTTSITYTIRNPGSGTLGDLAFSHDLDATVSGLVATGLPSSGVCGAGSSISGTSLLTFTSGALVAGQDCSFTVNLQVPASASAGTFPSLTSALFDNGAEVAAAASDDMVLTAAADLEVTKTDGVATVTAGQSTTYTIVARNNGPSTDPAAVLSDAVPANASTCSYTSVAAGGATGNTASGTGALNETLNLPNGGAVTYTMTCDVATGTTGSLSNTASIATSASVVSLDATNNSATDTNTIVTSSDLSVTLSDSADPIFAGGSVTYTVQVNNAGPSDATGVAASFTLPAGLTLSSTSGCGEDPSGVPTCTLGNLPAGGNTSFTVVAVADNGTTGTVTPSVSVSSAEADPVAANNTASETTTVNPQADIAVTKTDGVTSVVSGQSVTYTIVATNAGPSDDPAVTLEDTFPAGLTCSYRSVVSGGATGNTASGAGDIAETLSLPSGSSVTYTASCLVDPLATGRLSNTATVTASISDPVPGNNTATDADTAITPLSFGFTKIFNPSGVYIGQSATLTLTIDNSSNTLAATGMAFTDPLPAGMALAADPAASNSCNGTLTATGGANTLSLSGGSVNGRASCAISVQVVTSQVGSLANTTTVLTSNFPDAGPATANLAVNPAGAPVFVKAFSPSVINQGEISVLTFDIDNTANAVPANDVAFDDIFPAGMIVANDPSATNTCGGVLTAVAGSDSVSLSGATVTAATSCSLSVNVRAIGTGNLDNVTTDLTSTLASAAPATATLAVSAATAPGYAMSFTPDSIAQGQGSTLSFAIDNTANAIEAASLAFSGTLPGGLEIAAVPNATNSCGGTVAALAGDSSLSLTGGTVAAGAVCEVAVDVISTGFGALTADGSELTSTLATASAISAVLTVDQILAPGFTKDYGSATLSQGQTTTLTYVIDNAANSIGATDLDFDDLLVSSLQVVGPVTNMCGGTLTAAVGGNAVTLTGGSVAAGASCTIVMTVQAISTGSLGTNAPVLTSSLPTATAVVSDPVIVVQNNPLTVAMSFAPATIEQDQVSTLTYTLTNGSGIGATGVTLGDTLPSNLGILSNPTPSTTCAGALSTTTSSVALSGGTLAANSSCTITVQVTSVIVGSYDNTTETATSSLGVSTPASATLRVERATRGTVTIVQLSDTDGSYGFASVEPLLNFTINVSDGAGQYGPVDVRAGSYVVRQSTPGGVGNTEIRCNDTDSIGDAFKRTLTLNVDPLETVVCTIVSISTRQKTVETINSFLTKRADLILSSEPNNARRFDRLRRGHGNADPMQFANGDLKSFLPFTAKVDLEAQSYALKTSLLQMRQAGASLALAHGSTKNTLYVDNYRWDAWFEAKYKRFNQGENGAGHFGVAYFGVDYLVTPDLLLGAVLQFDDMEDINDENDTTARGAGWMFGPYVTARLTEGLYFDGRIAFGKSVNEVSPFNTYTDAFETTRWLVKGALTGEIKHGLWTIRPNASLSYYEETQKAYSDSLNVGIPSQTIKLGQIQLGPTFNGNFEMANGALYAPYFGFDATYNFGETTGVTLTDGASDAAVNGWRVGVKAGLQYTGRNGARLSVGGTYDGIGQPDYETWGLELELSIPLGRN
ncbi:autotransporter domain-containing protein [Primorskyibacter aestuariivivens]|uniref:DUF7933 domain-containing protein n=1 Tax=Primorskyibacter aestuariivivens TaxID=1888912 RepID=UPI0023013C4C|nr:autotransporter domain-containing protein [Primorskyibacter aestuariivivens]MDA7430455.1 autotransporter domain-containing protein [Primorskyibacter aestuariivivens]